MHTSEIDFRDRSKISWVTATAFGSFHILAVVRAVLHYLAGGRARPGAALDVRQLGIGMGYHRLHTHRSYTVPKAVEYFFAVCGTLTLEAVRSSGPRSIVFIISVPTSPATRTRRMTASGGRTFSGRSSARSCMRTPRSWASTRPTDEGPLLQGSEQLALGAGWWCWGSCCWRSRAGVAALGGVSPGGRRAALHLAGELGDTPLGETPVPDQRRLQE